MAASASFAATKRAQSLLSFLDKIRFFLSHPMISTLIRCIPKIVIPDILLLSFEWSRSSIIFFMGDEPQRYSIKPGSQNLPILGKRRKCGSQTRVRVSSCKPLPTSKSLSGSTTSSFQCPLVPRVGEMKKCLEWHFEYCARRVPTLRSERNTRLSIII